jgi:hypothetical protein
VRRFFYGPPNWLVTKFTSEDRRAFGFWVIVAAVIGSPIFGSKVWWVTLLSVVALVPNYSTETPNEIER